MTTTPDPKTVREIARTFLTDPDADELKYVVRSYIGYAGGAEHEAWCDAVRADAENATVTTTATWPDEQPQDGGDVRAVAIGERYTLGHGGAYCHCCHKAMREGTPVVRVTAAQCTDCAELDARAAKGGDSDA